MAWLTWADDATLIEEICQAPGAPAGWIWLVAHLMRAFQLREATAQALVDAYQVIAVVDGLDEMDGTDEPGYGSRSGQALRVLNRHQHGRNKARLVLTCRSGPYQALTEGQVWAHDAAHIQLG
ncbi:hypothetical protein [Nonomuraea sp. NPDC049758]|uniref:hypothetical protein n=1 Tax=Nonomuraea sp. NPDC049758 TaxID=3154360 RepID=UPI0034205314